MTQRFIKLLALMFIFILSIQAIADNTIGLLNPKSDWIQFFTRIKSFADVDTFVESGTYLGHTAAQAGLCFENVHTVELMTNFYQQAMVYLKDYTNISVYQGDSVQIFSQVLPKLVDQKKHILFWLDGHFMSCMSFPEDQKLIEGKVNYTPIMQELATIKSSGVANSIILIDDIRLFGTALNNKRIERIGDEHYPLIGDVCRLLESCNLSCRIFGDILIAYDKSTTLPFSPLIDACTISRFFDGNNYSIQQILCAEQLIAQAQGQESESIKELYIAFSKPWRWSNRSPHYNLWYGLILQQEGNHAEALLQFEQVINLGYDHWRIFWYLAQSLYQIGDYEGSRVAIKKILADNQYFLPVHTLLNKLEKLKAIDTKGNSKDENSEVK